MEPEWNPDPPSGSRFLFLGDSYTIGQGVPDSLNWPRQLVNRLIEKGHPVDTLMIIAKTGWTSLRLEEEIEKQNLLKEWDYISLLIGVNNQYQNRPLTEFRDSFRRLLGTMRHLRGNNPDGIFILTIPDYSVTPFGSRDSTAIRKQLDAFNQVVREESSLAGFPVINVTTVSKIARYRSDFLADDKLHPSPVMYSIWVDSVLNRISFILPDRD